MKTEEVFKLRQMVDQAIADREALTWELGDDRWAALVEAKRVLGGELLERGMPWEEIEPD